MQADLANLVADGEINDARNFANKYKDFAYFSGETLTAKIRPKLLCIITFSSFKKVTICRNHNNVRNIYTNKNDGKYYADVKNIRRIITSEPTDFRVVALEILDEISKEAKINDIIPYLFWTDGIFTWDQDDNKVMLSLSENPTEILSIFYEIRYSAPGGYVITGIALSKNDVHIAAEELQSFPKGKIEYEYMPLADILRMSRQILVPTNIKSAKKLQAVE